MDLTIQITELSLVDGRSATVLFSAKQSATCPSGLEPTTELAARHIQRGILHFPHVPEQRHVLSNKARTISFSCIPEVDMTRPRSFTKYMNLH